MTEESSQREPRVSFALKELLQDINAKLAGIDHKLDGKIDRTEFAGLVSRVEGQDGRINELAKRHDLHAAILSDREKRGRDAFSKREKIMGLLIGVAIILVEIFHSTFFVPHKP